MLLSPLPRGERGIDVTRGNSWSYLEGHNSTKNKNSRLDHYIHFSFAQSEQEI